MSEKTKDKCKTNPSQLLTFPRDSYLDRTSRPIYALIYLLGFIVLYEIGTIVISPETLTQSLSLPQIRVVSFIWVQSLIAYLGFSLRMTWIATPLVVVIILIALQITSHARWNVRIRDFLPMTVECILLAIPLIVLSLLLSRSLAPEPDIAYYQPANAVCSPAAILLSSPATDTEHDTETAPGYIQHTSPLLVSIVTAIGAGIYEELIFRLILISLLMLFFQNFLGASRKTSILLSIVISSILFSAHHHIIFVNGKFGIGEIFSAASFIFRTLAGVYFTVVFAVRGFGIAAGTHVFYDIIAAVLNIVLTACQE